MSAVCNATQTEDMRTQEGAFDCIAEIARRYYPFLESYMHALFQLTITNVKSPHEMVATRALEFWNVIAEAEFQIEHGLVRNVVALRLYHDLIASAVGGREQELHAWRIAALGATLG